MYYFKDDAEKEVKEALTGDSNDDLKIESISLEAPATSRTRTAADGAETYLRDSGAYMEIVAEAVPGLSNDEYAQLIFDFLKPVYGIKMNMELSVKIGRRYIFFETINMLGENKTPKLTLEQIKQAIVRFSLETIT